MMNEPLFEKGLERRKSVLGEKYVERAMGSGDAFGHEFQELLTEYCWGVCWGDERLTPRERSLLNLGMLASAGHTEEFETHFRAAFRNGLTKDQLKAALIQIAVYCGVPVGVNCFRIARRVLAEEVE